MSNTISIGDDVRVLLTVTRRVPLMKQELLTILDHMSLPMFCFLWGSCCSIFSFLCSVLYIIVIVVVLVFSDHCIVDHSSIYGFWLSPWYLQALRKHGNTIIWINDIKILSRYFGRLVYIGYSRKLIKT